MPMSGPARYVFQHPVRFGSRIPESAASRRQRSHRALRRKEVRMYSNILIAYNGTPESRLALEECIRLSPGPAAQIHLLAVATPMPIVLAGEFVAAVPTLDEEEAERRAMGEVLEAGRALLEKAGLNVSTHLEVGEPVNVIADLVEQFRIDLVIVGHSRHKPLALRWWRGSTDSVLVEKVRCSVLVACDPGRA